MSALADRVAIVSKRSVKKARLREREAAARPSTKDADQPTLGDAEPTAGGSAGRRLALAVALVMLLVVVGVVVLAGSGGGDAIAKAPTECLKSWNADSGARGTGGHAAASHGYGEAWVLYLGEDLEPNPEDGGSCTVVFPSPQPDPEPQFAGAVLVGKRWRPLNRATEISTEQIGELQHQALSAANANLFPDGSIAAR